MSVQIEPSELGFERPFNREVTQVLYIRNNGYEPVAFKVKTTAPKQSVNPLSPTTLFRLLFMESPTTT